MLPSVAQPHLNCDTGDEDAVHIEVEDLVSDNPANSRLSPVPLSQYGDGGHFNVAFDDARSVKKTDSDAIMFPTSTVPSRQPHNIFVELYDLHLSEGPEGAAEVEWQETARWIKYEEDVVGLDKHFGRPHVAFLGFHSLIQLRRCISKGVVLLDAKVTGFVTACDMITRVMETELKLDERMRERILAMLLTQHKHGHDHHPISLPKSWTSHHIARTNSDCPVNADEHSIARSISTAAAPQQKSQRKMSENSFVKYFRQRTNSHVGLENANGAAIAPRKSLTGVETAPNGLAKSSSSASFGSQAHHGSDHLMRKIPQDSESAQVFSGTIAELDKVKFCVMRLAEAVHMPEVLDIPVPIRFIFVILGPKLPDVDYHQIGRAVATMMSTEHFHESLYMAETKLDILRGFDEFLDESVVIPPGDISNRSLLSINDVQKALRRRQVNKFQGSKKDSVPEIPKSPIDSTILPNENTNFIPDAQWSEHVEEMLTRSKKPFGGFVKEFRGRLKKYGSDFRDALTFQCVTSMFFMFFAVFAPSIAFGGLMGEKTDNWMGVSEVLAAQSLSGIIWGFTAAQPLVIVASTGPFLVFESSLYEFCVSNGIEFLPFRFWIGLWIFLFVMIILVVEGPFLVKYLTRFTEDVFATIISLIFVYESLKFMILNFTKYHKLETLPNYCLPVCHDNYSTTSMNESMTSYDQIEIEDQPDTALLSAVLLMGSFILAYVLKQVRNSHLFGRTLRRAVGDFGVPISILVMVLIDAYAFPNTYLKRLKIPDTFGVSDPTKRGWVVPPMGYDKPFPIWAIFGAVVPAALAFILLFVECEIAEMLLSRPERGLRKGTGFHVDLFLMGILAVICSTLGIPWMCTAAVQTLAHVASLTVMKAHAPGERPKVDHVIEQRLTTIIVAVAIGACAFGGKVLKNIPMSVLFGVFLYLGFMSLPGIPFLTRITLFFIPEKYWPEVSYVQKVTRFKMHSFTILQIACLVILWIVKTFNASALAFPFVLMCIAIFRKTIVCFMYSPQELDALDGEEEEESIKANVDEVDFYEQAHGFGF